MPESASDAPTDPTPAPVPEPATVVYDVDIRTSIVIAGSILLMLAVFMLARSTRQTLTWISIGTLLALALNPIVDAISGRARCRRGVAVALVAIAAMTALLGVVFLLGPPAVREAGKFSEDLPRVVQQLNQLPIVGERLERADAADKVERWLNDLPARLGTDTSVITQVTQSVVSGFLAAFSTILVTLTLLIDGPRLLRGVRRLVPAHRRPEADKIGEVLYRTVGRYFAGSLFVAILNGTGILVLGLILGLPLVPLAAIWAMLTNLIPQIGGFLGGSVFVILGLSQSVTQGVICLVWFLLYQQFENHVLQPMIIGEAVDLSPPVTMMAALIGGSTAGVPGALIAVPLLGSAKAIYRAVRPAEARPSDPPRPRRRFRLPMRAARTVK
ncbi:MAG: AI-2E family transporter [Acidimicrobiia bacterium]